MRFFTATQASLACLALAEVAVAVNPLARADAVRSKLAAAQASSSSSATHTSTKVTASVSKVSASKTASSSAVATGYLNPKSKKFAVNGTILPLVDFDVGESYAGLLPVSNKTHEDKKLFFWFFPSEDVAASDEIVVWLNGGPGCSSFAGLLQENGPVQWQSGTYAPTKNYYSWSRLTNMVWIEQPIGVGYTQGTPDINNEIDLSNEFKGFWKNFVDTFNLHGRKMYITGESYGGVYVPYIANSFLEEHDTDYFNLSGIAINDPLIGDESQQQDVITGPYVEYWKQLFNLAPADYEAIQKADKDCGYQAYREKYFTFPPPKESFPSPYTDNADECSLWDNAYGAVLPNNPCFNIYHISDDCPFPYNPLGIVNSDDYSPPGAVAYFNRADVKRHLHAPANVTWTTCVASSFFGNPVFADGADQSIGPALNGVLQNVIERTNNVLIGSGGQDFILPTNGTLMVLQNTTWNGAKGLTAYPAKPFVIPQHPEENAGAYGGYGYQGVWQADRGVTFYDVHAAGHELPGYARAAGYRALQLLLGRIKSFADQTTPLVGCLGAYC